MSSSKSYKWPHRAIGLAQSMPRNWFGQQIAQIIRKLVVPKLELPIVCRIDSLNFEFHLLDNSSERKYLFMPWRFDRIERERLVKDLPTDGVFVDIGANVGIYTLFVASHMGASGRVIAFEPHPGAHQRLMRNIELNADTVAAEISVLQLGVADKEDSFNLTMDADDLGCSSLVAGTGTQVEVKCKPLLAVLESLGIEKIHSLKIDIEGAEDVALTPFFEEAPPTMFPDVIVIENSDDVWKTDLSALIRKSGYTLILKNRMNSVYQLDQK